MPDTSPALSPINRALGLAGAVLTAAEGLPPLAVLYAELVPGYAVPPMVREATGRALADLAAALPDEPGALLAFINARQDSATDKLIMLRAGLLRMRGNNFWIHHDAARLLDLLGLADHPETAAPCLLHASVALASPHEPGHTSMLRLILARRLLAVAPRDALGHALAAVHQGQADAMEVAREAASVITKVAPMAMARLVLSVAAPSPSLAPSVVNITLSSSAGRHRRPRVRRPRARGLDAGRSGARCERGPNHRARFQGWTAPVSTSQYGSGPRCHGSDRRRNSSQRVAAVPG